MLPAVAAMALLALGVCVLNLVLTLGVIRRLREHTALLDRLQAGPGAGMPDQMPAGAEVGEFAATTTDGEPLSHELLAGQTLVGFFSPTCQPCKERLPEFLEVAPDVPGGRQQVLAVAVGGEQECANLVADLAPVARVVVEPPSAEGPVSQAFKTSSYPTFGVLEGRRVVASGHELASLPVPTGT